ncbi:MAG: NUDIX domain-containing protein [Oscillospiraceae bacterium]|nr:NUDIX domain-containing protein [Oscillospiraceae bacterium]
MGEVTELWDILDENGNKTGKLHKRGKAMKEGEFRLLVQIWIKNSKGEFLISKRSPKKQDKAKLWECTGGSAVAGEDSLTAALRETKEELGLMLNPAKGKKIYSYKSGECFINAWLFREDFNINEVVLQENETCEAKWATKDEIIKMIDEGEFKPVKYFEYIYDMLEEY